MSAHRETVASRSARLVYSALLVLMSPGYLLRLWWRGRAEPLYRHAVGERWGFYADRGAEPSATTGLLWLHAVSLGETLAAGALLETLRSRRPDLRVLLTHATATGRAAGSKLLRPGDQQVWLPVDTPPAVERFFRRFRPSMGVLVETEIWPNLLRGAAAHGMPVVLANARLSARSLRAGRRVGAVLGPAFRSLAFALAQSDADASRLRAAGVQDVRVVGNLKFDLHPDPAKMGLGERWRDALARPVVLAAVTREGEEKPFLDAWKMLAAPRPLLVIVPRHPQRFDEVARAIEAAGFTLARRSGWADMPPPSASAADVWLGDSMHEMAVWYRLAGVALLGGSYAPLGGQNLIEAAACGCPVVMGPHTFNFADAAAGSLAAGASTRVDDAASGVRDAVALLGTEDALRMASRAVAFAAAHRGAAGRMADAILEVLERRTGACEIAA